MRFTRSRKHLGINARMGGRTGEAYCQEYVYKWKVSNQKAKKKREAFQIWKLLVEMEMLVVCPASPSYFCFLNSWVFPENSEGTRDLLGNQKHWESGWRLAELLHQKELANRSPTGDCFKKASLGGNQEDGWSVFHGMCEINLAP